MRASDVQKPPGIAEAIDWVAALSLLGIERLDVAAIDRTLGSVLFLLLRLLWMSVIVYAMAGLGTVGVEGRPIQTGQLAVLGLENAEEAMKRPEDDLGRLSRGIPLWLSESLYFSANWMAVSVVATLQHEHYGILVSEWSAENVRQLVDSGGESFDYVFTGSIRQSSWLQKSGNIFENIALGENALRGIWGGMRPCANSAFSIFCFSSRRARDCASKPAWSNMPAARRA